MTILKSTALVGIGQDEQRVAAIGDGNYSHAVFAWRDDSRGCASGHAQVDQTLLGGFVIAAAAITQEAADWRFRADG